VDRTGITKVIRPKEIKEISVDVLLKGYRYRQDLGDIESLKQSIQNSGLWHPIVVKEDGDDPPSYKLLAGGRRLAAVKELGWDKVMANIYPEDLDDLDSHLIELFENLDRKDMEYPEQVALTGRVHKLMQEKLGAKGTRPNSEGHSMHDTATLLGRAVSTVSADIKLAEAIEVLPELAKCKDKREAMKMLEALEGTLHANEIAAEIEKQRAETPTEKMRHQIMNSYIVGDFFEKVKDVQDGSIDLIEIDADWGAIDLESRPVENQELHKMKVAGYTKAEGDYLEYMDRVLAACVPKLNQTGWMLNWCAFHPNGNAIWMLMEKHGLRGPGTPIIWAKPSGQVRAVETNLVRTYEVCFYGRKPDARLIIEGRRDVIHENTVASDSRIHITEKPIELMENLYRVFVQPGSRIYIPFLGSGNGILAAYNLGCTAFGSDLSQETKNKFMIRVDAGYPPNYKSFKK
jgi:ParB-like chromosome segregation protein Spo0J